MSGRTFTDITITGCGRLPSGKLYKSACKQWWRWYFCSCALYGGDVLPCVTNYDYVACRLHPQSRLVSRGDAGGAKAVYLKPTFWSLSYALVTSLSTWAVSYSLREGRKGLICVELHPRDRNVSAQEGCVCLRSRECAPMFR